MVLDGTEPSIVESSTTEAQEENFLSPLRSRDTLNESDCERHFKDYGKTLLLAKKLKEWIQVNKNTSLFVCQRDT